MHALVSALTSEVVAFRPEKKMAPANKDAVGIAVPTTGFRRFMFFNRFTVEREEGFVRILFGNVNKANVLQDAYGTVISEMELEVLKPSTMDYLGAQGTLLDAPTLWQPAGPIPTEVANHMVMARHGSIAETILYSISFCSALALSREASVQEPKKHAGVPNLFADPMALLRSPLAAQQHLIRLLFAAGEPSLLEKR
ncbi:MAG: hypothetical protein KGS61_19345 [Verrucomicrobia bacterium]|nr:hypothetical protein [Verrucomicrobiota bacterium]